MNWQLTYVVPAMLGSINRRITVQNSRANRETIFQTPKGLEMWLQL
jgi:hypothetical protein